MKIRDKRDEIKEVQWNTFGDNWQEEKKHYNEVWDWAKRTFGEISDIIDNWTIEDRFEKWMKPLLQRLGYETEPRSPIDLSKLPEEEQDNILNKIQITHKFKNHAKIAIHICEDDDFNERNDLNYQKKSQHDHFQRFILLNEGIKWGFLTNGKYLRLLGEYSNIYAKGYVQFDLDSIFINKDESEFWIFYTFVHNSRFSEIYGLNSSKWIEKLKKDWEKTLDKLKVKNEIIKDSDILNDDVLNIYNNILSGFIERANERGIMSVKSSDSEIFMQELQKNRLDVGETERDFYLKSIESVISDINNNKSILRRLQEKSREEGVEIGKTLRKNVKMALELMGEALIQSNPSFINDILKDNVDIKIKEFYQELLRITYRIIFILYAEAKDLLPGVATIYYNDLGLTYLRKKAEQPIRDDQNVDLWHRLLLLFKYLDVGEKSLGINAFSGELFNPERIGIIFNEKYNLTLPNSIVLRIIRELTIVDTGIGLQRINYIEIGEEEIGGIYEALLDFQPRYVKKDSPIYHFILEEIDTERKGSATYYTHKGLVDLLLKTALKPIVENKLKGLKTKTEKLNAILSLKICDPACGGGSFLLAALDYLGKIYAQIKSDQEFPDDEKLREARRKVLQSCIYGVDLNPMALELTKISLWLKVSVKNKPLTFLDNHLKEGNSLIGFPKKQKIGKIPINAFNAIKGNSKTGIPDENRKYVNNAKKRLKDFSIISSINSKSSIQKTLFPYKDSENYSKIANDIFKMSENDLKELKDKIQCYLKLKESNSWKNLNLQINLWIASFLWEMDDNFNKDTPTDAIIVKAKKESINENNPTIKETKRLSKKYKFFNWYLEFPEVFQKKNPGFDCILMNPPWDVLTIKETEFFKGKSDEIVKTTKKSDRIKQIKKLKQEDANLFNQFVDYYRNIKKQTFYFKYSNFYDLSTSGSINLYALFLERAWRLIKSDGKVGAIIQSSLLTNQNLSNFFQELVVSNSLETLFDFHNRRLIFPINAENHFSLITYSNSRRSRSFILASFSNWYENKLQNTLDKFLNYESENKIEDYFKEQEIEELKKRMDEGGSLIDYAPEDFKLLNPNTKTCARFLRRSDINIIKKAYLNSPILIKRDSDGNIISDPWSINFKRMLDASKDSNLFLTKEELIKKGFKPIKKGYEGGIWQKKDNSSIIRYLPVYGGTAIWYYDYRYNEAIPKKDKTQKRKADHLRVSDEKHQDLDYFHVPMYWIEESNAFSNLPDIWDKEWYLGYRNVSGPTNKRCFIIIIIPKYPAVNSLIITTFSNFRKEIICFIANTSSIIFDFIARSKLSGNNFNYFIVEQLPILPPQKYNEKVYNLIKERVLELTYTSRDLSDFANDYGISEKKNPFVWNDHKRLILKAELDALIAKLYKFNEKEVKYILNTQYAVRDEEISKYGEYVTKKYVLRAFKEFKTIN